MNTETTALDPKLQGFPQPLMQIVGGPQGPGLIYKDRTIHRADDPWTEAAGWLARAQQHFPNQAPGLALVFGLGLGYHLKLLRRNYPGLRLLVYEPSPDIKEF
jgi:hypothetical protein